MEKRIIRDNFKKMPKLGNYYNLKLYLDGEDLIKYFDDPVCDNSWVKIERRLELLDKIIEPEFVLPKYLLYLDDIETSNLRAYAMDYLKNYNTIGSIINNPEYSHKEKLEICRKLCDTFINLEKYRISYWDVHSENILINGSNIKVCDMDSTTSRLIDGEYSYRIDLADSYRYLTAIILSILYNMDEFDIINSLKSKKSRKFVRESKMFSRVADNDGYIFYPDKYLDTFTEDYIEETKKLLLR